MATIFLSGAGLYRKDKHKGEAFSLGKQTIVILAEVFNIFQVATKKDVKNDLEKEIHSYLNTQAVLKDIQRALGLFRTAVEGSMGAV